MNIFIIKLAALLIAGSALIVFLIKDWDRYKIFLLYFLIILISQTGFSYDLNQTFRTSFAELSYFLMIAISFCLYKNRNTIVFDKKIIFSVKIYLIISVLGILLSVLNGIYFWSVVTEFKSYVLYLFYIFIIPWFIDNKSDIKRIVWVFIISSIIPLIYILPNLSDLQNMVESGRASAVDMTRGWGALNIFVGYAIPNIFIMLSMLLTVDKKYLKVFIAILLIMFAYIVFYTQTRTGWFSLIICLLIYAYLLKIKLKIFVLTTIAVVLLFGFGQLYYVNKVLQKRIIEQTIEKPDSSLEKRFYRWNTAVKVFMTSPVFGKGWGANYYLKNNDRISDKSYPSLPNYHNSFFEILVQLGVLGVLSFYGIWLASLKHGYEVLTRAYNHEYKQYLIGFFCASISCLIYSFGEQQFLKIETASISWLVLGCMLGLCRLMIIENKNLLIALYLKHNHEYRTIKSKLAQL